MMSHKQAMGDSEQSEVVERYRVIQLPPGSECAACAVYFTSVVSLNFNLCNDPQADTIIIVFYE